MVLKKKLFVPLAISLLANVALVVFVFLLRVDNKEAISGEGYPYLSKRIFVEDQNDIFVNFTPLRGATKDYVTKVGPNLKVYFEFLPSGVSIGMNEKDETKMASLVKIPTVMAIYKKVERGNLRYDDKILIKEEYLDPTFGSLWRDGAGTELTVNELIWKTLVESDNTAHNALYNTLSDSEKFSAYADLDITFSGGDGKVEGDPLISAKSYSSILRSLYLSSYLSEKDSNEILDILSKTLYNDKIPAPLPVTVKIAHKFGILVRSETNTSVISDCGIIYVPKRPYILCVMYEGDEKEATHYIQTLSKMVYEYVVRIPSQD